MNSSRCFRLAFFIWGALSPLTSRADFFVSAQGKDTGTGTIDNPFATPEQARDAVRDRKRAGNLPASGLTIWFRGGDFFRTNALDLTEADSGSPGAPIVWRAYQEESVRWIGGRLLRGFHPVTDPAIQQRLDTAARSNVVVLDLRAQGITAWGDLHSRGFSRPTTAAHAELFFAGQPMTLARWPNEGTMEKIAGFPGTTKKGDEHGGNIGDLPGGFLYSGERPRRWKETDDLWVHGYWAWDWANSYERVAQLDREQHRIVTAPPYGLYGFRTGQRFYFLNILEELDQPGEWFLDRAHGQLYFWPPRPLETAETILSTLNQPLIRLTKAHHIRVEGLNLEASRGNGIEIREGSENQIVGCTLRNLGNEGVLIQSGKHHGVTSCDITATGDGGVSLNGGDRQTLVPADHYVENSHFQFQGRWSKCYVPAILMNGVGQRASHNLIHDHPHCAILFNGNDHLIEFNEIHHIALETGDVGAIYTGRDYTYRGNRIRFNYLHETGGLGMGSMGVYMDDCVSGTEVFGNIFYKVHWAMFIGGGRDHRVENNLFVECDPAVRADGRGLDPSPVWRGMVDDYMRQQLTAVPAALYRQRYPELKTLDAHYGAPPETPIRGAAFKGVPPENNVIRRNVCYGKWLDIGWRATPDFFSIHDNTVIPEIALTVGPKTQFVVPPDSPAWKTGFQAIPFSRIGLILDEARGRLARQLPVKSSTAGGSGRIP